MQSLYLTCVCSSSWMPHSECSLPCFALLFWYTPINVPGDPPSCDLAIIGTENSTAFCTSSLSWSFSSSQSASIWPFRCSWFHCFPSYSTLKCQGSVKNSSFKCWWWKQVLFLYQYGLDTGTYVNVVSFLLHLIPFSCSHTYTYAPGRYFINACLMHSQIAVIQYCFPKAHLVWFYVWYLEQYVSLYKM